MWLKKLIEAMSAECALAVSSSVVFQLSALAAAYSSSPQNRAVALASLIIFSMYSCTRSGSAAQTGGGRFSTIGLVGASGTPDVGGVPGVSISSGASVVSGGSVLRPAVPTGISASAVPGSVLSDTSAGLLGVGSLSIDGAGSKGLADVGVAAAGSPIGVVDPQALASTVSQITIPKRAVDEGCILWVFEPAVLSD